MGPRTRIALLLAAACAAASPVLAQRAAGIDWRTHNDQSKALSRHDDRCTEEVMLFALEAVGIAREIRGPDDWTVATSLNNLAVLHKLRGELDQAELRQLEALAIYDKTCEPGHLYVGGTLVNLAVLHRTMHHDAKADAMYRRALGIFQSALGPTHPSVAGVLNDLAELYRAQGDTARARPLVMQALAIVEDALGPDHPYVAICLDNLALLEESDGNAAAAEALHARTLTVGNTAFPALPPELDDGLDDIAALDDLRAVDGDDEMHRATLRPIIERWLPSHRGDFPGRLHEMAEQYRARGDVARAESLLVRAVAYAEMDFGPDEPRVVRNLHGWASFHERQGDFPAALPLRIRALAIMERQPESNEPYIAHWLVELGALYETMGAYAEAEPLYARALAINEAWFAPEDAPAQAGDRNHRRGGRARIMVNERVLEGDLALITDFNRLANVHRHLGNFADAERLYRRALAAAEALWGPDHRDFARQLDKLATLYRDMGEPDDDLDGVPDICEYALGDFDLDGAITFNDLLVLLGLWGTPDPVIGDLDGDGAVGFNDLLLLLGSWGPLP